jgi:hypothetical protein
MRQALGTDKGKARLDGVCSGECDYAEICGREPVNLSAFACFAGGSRPFPTTSRSTPLLGLSTKFLAFSGSAADAQATAGLSLVGSGTEVGSIRVDTQIELGEVTEDDPSHRTPTRSGAVDTKSPQRRILR